MHMTGDSPSIRIPTIAVMHHSPVNLTARLPGKPETNTAAESGFASLTISMSAGLSSELRSWTSCLNLKTLSFASGFWMPKSNSRSAVNATETIVE